jgi:hypothetical protein
VRMGVLAPQLLAPRADTILYANSSVNSRST